MTTPTASSRAERLASSPASPHATPPTSPPEPDQAKEPARRRARATLGLLGPAFVAAVAYVDPGNVATNLTAGARYGYLLVWVLVAATASAGLIQYLSAKLGVATELSLPEVLRATLPARARTPFWAQAEVVAIATDFAEVVGGAIALQILFNVPLPIGGAIVAAISLVLLKVQDRYGPRRYELVIAGMLAIIAIGFAAGLFVSPPDPAGALTGMIPRLDGPNSIVLAAGMLGATVMPHVVYLHSALARDRMAADGRTSEPRSEPRRRRFLLASRIDVVVAMIIAGSVNIAMLLLAASALKGTDTDTIEGAYTAIGENVGPGIAILFAIALLVSGVASTSVGAHSGAVIMDGLLRRRVPMLLRRLVTVIPAIVILSLGANPTSVLVLSQVVLSFGIPFALVPLVRATASRRLMGQAVNAKTTTAIASVITLAIIALNVTLIVLTFTGT